jgi:hypothetical protein
MNEQREQLAKELLGLNLYIEVGDEYEIADFILAREKGLREEHEKEVIQRNQVISRFEQQRDTLTQQLATAREALQHLYDAVAGPVKHSTMMDFENAVKETKALLSLTTPPQANSTADERHRKEWHSQPPTKNTNGASHPPCPEPFIDTKPCTVCGKVPPSCTCFCGPS